MAYYGQVEYDLTPTEDKNVTVIIAANDVGKTCFFTGFNFCLYGAGRAPNLLDFININSREEGVTTAYVSIFAEHQGEEINIVRLVQPKGIVTGKLSNQHLEEELKIWKNGVQLVDDRQETYDFINSIVHEDAAKYFFFDGEKIETYNIASKADYKEAIWRILGIKEVEFAIIDLAKLEKEFEIERDNLVSKKGEGNQLIKEKNKVAGEIEQFNENITAFETELKEIETRIVYFEDLLKQNDTIKFKVEERQELKQKIKEFEDKIGKIEGEKTKVFQENGTLILGNILVNQLKPSVQELIANPVFAMPNKDFLNELMQRETCICGEPLTEKHREHLNQFIEKFDDQDKELRKLIERKISIQTLDLFSNHSANAQARYNELCKEKVQANIDKGKLEEREIELRAEVGKYDENTGQKYAEELTQLEEGKKSIEVKITIANHDLIKTKEILESLERKIASLSVDKEKADAEQKLGFTRKLIESLKEYKETLIEAKRKEVETKSTDVFLQLTNKPTKYHALKLSDEYELLLELSDRSLYRIERGRSLNPSTGQSKVVSLAYIAGINQSSDSVAPIIIDNPLGLFSSEHRERVVSYLPKFGAQIVFLTNEADLSPQYFKLVQPFINYVYYLEDKSLGAWNKTEIVRKEAF